MYTNYYEGIVQLWSNYGDDGIELKEHLVLPRVLKGQNSKYGGFVIKPSDMWLWKKVGQCELR